MLNVTTSPRCSKGFPWVCPRSLRQGKIVSMDFQWIYELFGPISDRVIAALHDGTANRTSQRVSAGAPGNVLEVTFGSARPVVAYGKYFKTRVVSVGVSQKFLLRARRAVSNGNVAMVRATPVQLPFRNGHFDAVLCTLILNLLSDENVREAMAELSRVMVPGGRIVVGTLEPGSGLLDRLWRLVHGVVPAAVGYLRPVDLTGLLEESGLRVIKDERVTGTPEGRVCTLIKAVG